MFNRKIRKKIVFENQQKNDENPRLTVALLVPRDQTLFRGKKRKILGFFKKNTVVRSPGINGTGLAPRTVGWGPASSEGRCPRPFPRTRVIVHTLIITKALP